MLYPSSPKNLLYILLYVFIFNLLSCNPSLRRYDYERISEQTNFSDRVTVLKEECRQAYKRHLRAIKYNSKEDRLVYHGYFQYFKERHDVVLPSEYHIRLGSNYTEHDLLNQLRIDVDAVEILVVNTDSICTAVLTNTYLIKKNDRNIYQNSNKYSKRLELALNNDYDIIFNIVNSYPDLFGYKDGKLDIYEYQNEDYHLIDFETFKATAKE